MERISIKHNASLILIMLARSEKRYWSYAELKEYSGLDETDLAVAIGWLIRENEIMVGKDVDNGHDEVVTDSTLYF